MIAYEIGGKRFIAQENMHGRSGAETIFKYFIGEAGSIYGFYAGGQIRTGQLVGRITAEDQIEMLFQCITTLGELLSGHSSGRVSRDAAGMLHLDFEWKWLSGEEGGGTSSYVEAHAAD